MSANVVTLLAAIVAVVGTLISPVLTQHYATRGAGCAWGHGVVLRIVRPLTRCVMIDMVQDQAGERNDLLEILAEYHVITFGVSAAMEQPGWVAAGDVCSWA